MLTPKNRYWHLALLIVSESVYVLIAPVIFQFAIFFSLGSGTGADK